MRVGKKLQRVIKRDRQNLFAVSANREQLPSIGSEQAWRLCVTLRNSRN